jgi:hypothetical protein
LFRTKVVVYCAVDPFLSSRGKFLYDFDRFQEALDEHEIPMVWLTSQSRLQIDDSRRRAGHSEPFVGEDGCAVYLPEDYFHLKPGKTVRLGRFTCIPIAKLLPATKQELEALSEKSGIAVVPLHSLSPKELSQNLGLPTREAELVRQRDFDELFFFAGASDADILRFLELALPQNLQLRQHGVLWSLAAGANTIRCIRELGDLYDRALRAHVQRFAIATPESFAKILPACDRGVRLLPRTGEEPAPTEKDRNFVDLAVSSETLWDTVIGILNSRS